MACCILLFGLLAHGTAASGGLLNRQPGRLTAERLKQLKTTSNDPAGDSFVDSRDRLLALIDAFVADSSRASPLYLLLAANTAVRLDRVEDSAFLLYAAQLRRAFDAQRIDLAVHADARDAAIYLSFLNETTGMTVNPAVMRQPKLFASAIVRIEAWDVVAASDAFYPELASVKSFKIPRVEWAGAAQKLKEDFLTAFGRPMTALLNDREYFEAFSFVQRVNLGEIELTDQTKGRFEKSLETMAAIEKRVKGSLPAVAPSAAGGRPPAVNTELPIRVGGNVPAPRVLRRVEPSFPPGVKDSVILEVTISAAGRVTATRALRGEPALVTAAEQAVREWEFEPTIVDGRPVAVLYTVSFTAR